MTNGNHTYYALKGLASGSVTIAAGFIGYFSEGLLAGTSPVPLIIVIGILSLVVVARGAEARLDEKVVNQNLDPADTRLTFAFLVGVIILVFGISILTFVGIF